jgi:hypothetical protein
MITTTAVNDGAAKTAGCESEREPHKVLRRRIGSTDYIVTVRFSNNTSETLEQKLLRLMESEVRYDKQ